jgi:hypothetical protein
LQTAAQFGAFVAAHRWTFAKTMPHNPHEWLARTAVPEADFEAAVKFINSHGYIRRFGGADYFCVDVGPHRYWGWKVGYPVERVAVLNRAVNQ